MNLHEVGWAAGLFEGEGSVYVSHSADLAQPRLRLSLAQRDNRHIVERFMDAVGVGSISYSKANNTDEWHVQGARAHEVMELLRPIMGEESRKTQKYLAALAEGCRPEKLNGWATGARQ